jgi:hypothetical protein
MRRILLVLAALAVSPLAAAAPSSPSDYPGCVYNTSPPTLSNGQVGLTQCDANGNIKYSVSPSSTQTTNTISVVSVTATSGVLIAANSGRKSLSFMNIGANSCTITTANPAVSGQGYVLSSGGPLPSQGGSQQYDSKVPTNAYYAICPANQATTIAVEEGN